MQLHMHIGHAPLGDGQGGDGGVLDSGFWESGFWNLGILDSWILGFLDSAVRVSAALGTAWILDSWILTADTIANRAAVPDGPATRLSIGAPADRGFEEALARGHYRPTPSSIGPRGLAAPRPDCRSVLWLQ